MRIKTKNFLRVFGAAGWGVLAFSASVTHGQPTAGTEGILNFKAPLENHPSPNEAQVKTLLEGDKARLQTGGFILVSSAKVKTFSTNGTLELVALAPECLLDSEARSVASTGRLQVQTADGKFFLEGEGFFLGQSNANLVISNRVHTVIRLVPGKSSRP